MNKYYIEDLKSPNILKRILKIMRITLFLFFTCILFSTASNSYSQIFTINLKSTSIKDACKEIERISDYFFVFSDNAEKMIKEVIDTQIESKDITDVLNIIFNNTSLAYKILDKQIVVYESISPSAFKSLTPVIHIAEMNSAIPQQQNTKQITGKIIDIQENAVIGANVIEAGTTNGTVTDINGNFTLNVRIDAILQISYIGYISQTINTEGKTNFNITLLEDMQALNEVVVVGYGTQRKETLTGAVSAISSKELMTTKTDNMVTNMQGKIAGLLYRPNSGEPGDFNMSLSIRGFGTPVIVIDGVVYTQNGTAELAQLNSEDVENISVLKDASAMVYGMNAANGVIIVTTKKGINEKVKFSYSGMLGTKQPTGLPQTVSAYDFRVIANEMARNAGLADVYDTEILELYKKNEYPYMDYDWLDLYLRDFTPIYNNHTFSARGGTDKVNFFSSLGYADDKGPLVTDLQYYRRYTLRNNLTVQLSDNLKMNASLFGRLDESQASRDIIMGIYKVLMNSDRGTGPFTESGNLSLIAPDNRNPETFGNLTGGYRRWHNTNVSTRLDLTYTAPFLPGLEINLLGSYETRTQNYSRLTRKNDYYDYFTDKYVLSESQDKYTNEINLYNRYYAKLQVNYSYKIDDHSFAFMGAVEASQDRFDYLSGARSYNDVYTYDILNQGSPSGQATAGYREFRRLAAFLGRVNYDYKGRYLLEGMLRRNGSYRYAPGKRWVVFPSVSAGWRISEESFFKDNVTFINNLKLRASYGESGRDQGSSHQYIAAFTADQNRNYIFSDGEYTVGMVAPGVTTDQLTWVTAKIFNTAVDADFLKNKLNVSFEYFVRKNTGLLDNRQTSVPNTFGATFPQENINSDMNIGLELGVKYRDQIGHFGYSIGANITFTRTKRLHDESAPFTSQWDRWKNGNEDRFVGRGWIYDHNGQYTSLEQLETAPLIGGARGNSMMLPGGWRMIDTNGDGRINTDDQQPINWSYGVNTYNSGASSELDGSQTWNRVNPPLQFGFPIDATYKSWDLSILLTGASLYCLNIAANDVWGYGRFPSINERFTDRWHPADPNADRRNPETVWIPGYYPALTTSSTGTNNTAATTIWRPKVTYLRLKNVELGYTIPKNLIDRFGIDNCRFYLNASNLLTFASKLIRMYDPEKHEGDFDVGLTHPLMKSYNFGINLTF